jgi:Na+/melibiose symporter-like transporter
LFAFFSSAGPALGSALYQVGGFLLPFLVVGSWCMMGAILVLFAIPNVKVDTEEKTDGRKKLTLLDLAKVTFHNLSWNIILLYNV